ncbi:hypothetical protein SAMN06272737_1048 [Blastococcus mobilis]|uniref:Uncharacterized protein n=2 Tax=Blastococcus mobilis TaxID=1938746 RepID=A0A238VMX5_9ACTN|nr:hypothetical protein SAMN06272737_1048 [Blastococcus mobilis]
MSSRRVRFYEILSDDGQRLQPVDLERHFFDVVASLPDNATEHWQNEYGLRVRGRVYRAPEGAGARARNDLIVLDRVHREPNFNYVQGGTYSEHRFPDPDTEFAEPKFLAFFERNLVATFTSGLRMTAVEACLNTWRAARSLAPIQFVPVVDTDRLTHMAKADSVGKLWLQLPADVARRIYDQRGTTLGRFLRSRAQREGRVGVELQIDISDRDASDELRDELAFLMEDDVFSEIVDQEDTQVVATYYTEDSKAPHSHNFLGQALAITVQVEVPEPELGPQLWSASEALVEAFNRRRDRLVQVVPEAG